MQPLSPVEDIDGYDEVFLSGNYNRESVAGLFKT
jgi:hypothetical protein